AEAEAPGNGDDRRQRGWPADDRHVRRHPGRGGSSQGTRRRAREAGDRRRSQTGRRHRTPAADRRPGVDLGKEPSVSMGIPAMFVALAGIGMITAIVTAPFKMASRRARYKAMAADGEIEKLNAIIGDMGGEMSKLRDRVAVLERLVTSDDRRLADE